MLPLLQSIFSILVMTEFVLGNFANGFIVLVNYIAWVKRQKISSADQILTGLAVSRIGLLWVILINWYATLLNPALYSLEVRLLVHIAWTANNHFSIWLATSLSVFYLFKIANFSNLIFLRLKWRVKSVVFVMLLGSLFFLVFHVAVVSIYEQMQMKEYEGNITRQTKLRDIAQLMNMTVFTLMNFVPFAISLTSFLLLIFSLWKHLKKMRSGGKRYQDSSTKVHIKAMQTVISFLLLLVCYFLTLIAIVWSSNRLQNKLIFLLCKAIGILYPSSHSFILIWGNKKLREDFLSFLWQLKGWLKKGYKRSIMCLLGENKLMESVIFFSSTSFSNEYVIEQFPKIYLKKSFL
ncbi:taste receptor type 2 member 136 [Canis lupus familiaris]|uniref:Taste receptor type 2 n=1 Tax=Canis lupus familiaris TaxID=9615 RepID=Q2ABC8_CANLF|nr:taste receptor type 2 member 136 [Canis lupus familiaris]BAE80339.1 bitter taste receptor [Canis lupus familiaris]|eukprot:NP_001138979.1 taste receptor type 2 member 136 [Canis lupus familiaris]